MKRLFERRGPSGRSSTSAVLDAALVALIGLVITLHQFPPMGLMPNRDSGVFLYAAQRIVEGELPYRDVWDHKPPMVYLLNLPAALMEEPLWGLWLLAVGWVVVSSVLLHSELRAVFGRLPAALGVTATLCLLGVCLKGNLPEEYVLLLQVGVVREFRCLVSGKCARPVWASARIGMLGGVAALLKPTLVGLWLTIGLTGLCVSWERDSRHEKGMVLLAGLGGVGVVLAVFAAGLGLTGIGAEFWSAVVEYNLAYATPPARWSRWLAEVLRGGATGIVVVGMLGLLYLAAAHTVMGLKRRAGDALTRGIYALGVVALVGLPIEGLLAISSARAYLQYLIPSAVPAGILTACVAHGRWSRDEGARGRGWSAGFLLLGVSVAIALSGVKITVRRAAADQGAVAVRSIEEMSPAGSPVLVWGAETQVLAIAKRRAPSRYVYLYPLTTVGYVKPEMVEQFAVDLRTNPPAIILDTSAVNPVVPPVDPARRKAWTSSDPQYMLTAELGEVADWIYASYDRAGFAGAWEVYVLRSP